MYNGLGGWLFLYRMCGFVTVVPAVDVESLPLPGVPSDVGVTAFFARLSFGLAVAMLLASALVSCCGTVWEWWYRRRGTSVTLALYAGVCGCVGMVFGGVLCDRLASGAMAGSGAAGVCLYLCLVSTVLTVAYASLVYHANRLPMAVLKKPVQPTARHNPSSHATGMSTTLRSCNRPLMAWIGGVVCYPWHCGGGSCVLRVVSV